MMMMMMMILNLMGQLKDLECFWSTEIETDGVIEPDTDEVQEMGDYENLEVPCF